MLMLTMEVYNDEFKYHCTHCEFQAKEEYFLSEHIEAFHQSKLSCKEGYQTFFKEDELSKHIENNNEENKYQCNECDYNTEKKDILNFHIKTSHSNLSMANNSDNRYKYSCSRCDKKI